MHTYAKKPNQSFLPTPSILISKSLLQRSCACGGRCSKCQQEQSRQEPGPSLTAQTKASGEVETAVPPVVHDVLHSSGQPLDAATQDFMESRFGHDFSRVRVHNDRKAAESAALVNAEAYTVGQHIVFGSGHFAPGTAAGRELLAHELAHTLQQEAATDLSPTRVSTPHDPSERMAESVATQALHSGPKVGAPFFAGHGAYPQSSLARQSWVARQQTPWPAWHQEELAAIAKIAGKSDGTSADAKFPALLAHLCLLTRARAESLHQRLNPSAAGMKGVTDDFPLYVKSKFPANYGRIISILAELAAGKVPVDCKPPEPEEKEQNGKGTGDGKGKGNKKGQGDETEQDGEPGGGSGEMHAPCEVACRALESMSRSVEGICRLAGPDDSRCKAARQRLQRSKLRVRKSQCGCAEKPLPVS